MVRNLSNVYRKAFSNECDMQKILERYMLRLVRVSKRRESFATSYEILDRETQTSISIEGCGKALKSQWSEVGYQWSVWERGLRPQLVVRKERSIAEGPPGV